MQCSRNPDTIVTTYIIIYIKYTYIRVGDQADIDEKHELTQCADGY